MQEKVVKVSGQDVGVLVVWLDVLRFDSEKATEKARRIFGEDARIRHFWDPKNRSGSAVGKSLGWKKDDLAWDMYLFYGPDAKWGEKAPQPLEYVHQLSRRMDDGHFFRGEDLAKKLDELTAKLLQPEKHPATAGEP